MSYELKKLQILGGGFSLLPPGDKTPKTDYLLAQNWRVDQDGKLVSRAGYGLQAEMPGFAYLHSAALYGATMYLAGVRTQGDGAVAVPGSGYIAAGLDTRRVGMVAMNGWMFIMNRLVQGKHNFGTGFVNWQLYPPGNACWSMPGNANPAGPNGTYTFYVTFGTSDLTAESNPGPASVPVTLNYQDVILLNIPISSDPQVGVRNVYALGGTLGSAYLVATINDNVTNTAVFNAADLARESGLASLQPEWNDGSATYAGTLMPTTNDPPPAALGLCGPYISRLFAWNTVAHANRLFWTDPDLPMYWPGSQDEGSGNWVDVGDYGEGIVWCTIHANTLVIYKERSVWTLTGDPDTGYLERTDCGVGLVNAFAVATWAQVDYFVAPGGLCVFNMAGAADASGAIKPLFNTVRQFAGPLAPPGSIPAEGTYGVPGFSYYDCALGCAMGKVYLAYNERGGQGRLNGAPLMVFNGQRWMYHRSTLPGLAARIRGFVFDGINMWGLCGNGSTGWGHSLDDFALCVTVDAATSGTGLQAIVCVYQSHYEDAGAPDNQKCWIEVAIDYETQGDAGTVYVAYDNGNVALTQVGTIQAWGRTTQSFPLRGPSNSDGVLAKNISVAVEAGTQAGFIIHNVYLYCYLEARLANAASTLPTDLGVPKVKQAKELLLDIDNSGGETTAALYSDLPGNALAPRQYIQIAKNGGRAQLKLPFPATEGYIWRIALLGTQFRLYAARLLVRAVGVYVEAYEAAAGFVWDSMEMTFESGITKVPKLYQIALAAVPIKRFREISLEIDTFGGNVLVSFLTDLPGNAQAVRFTATINTGAAGRRFVRLPLPAGISPPVEGRLCRLQLSGASKFILYDGAVELIAVGVYVEGYEAASGAVYDSRETDFGKPDVKEARELELDIETTGAVAAYVYSDLAGHGLPTAPIGAFGVQVATVNTGGRQKVLIPLNVAPGAETFYEGRLLRLILSGLNAFRLYGARMRLRSFGCYLTSEESGTGALWDTTDLDLGTQTVKQFRELELDIWAYGTYYVTVYTDLPYNSMAARVQSTQPSTNGRTTVQIPLPQGAVPDNYIFGRLVRVTITSSAAFKLFGARMAARPIGVYVESYEAAAGAVWDSFEQDLGSPEVKTYDRIRFEMDSDGPAGVEVTTDLPGEAQAERTILQLTAGATARHWAGAEMPLGTPLETWGVEGRSIRMVASSAMGFRIYRVQVRAARMGRYLSAGGPADALSTLEFDFQSERVKMHKWVEVDMRGDAGGTVQMALYTDQSGRMAQMYSRALPGTGSRGPVRVVLPPGIRARLLRISLTSTGTAARIFHVRVWSRPVNEPDGKWAWQDYPVEQSELLPQWHDIKVPETPAAFTFADLPVPPTAPQWEWMPFPVNPTEPQWFWAKVLPVEETPDVWTAVDVPFEVLQ